MDALERKYLDNLNLSHPNLNAKLATLQGWRYDLVEHCWRNKQGSMFFEHPNYIANHGGLNEVLDGLMISKHQLLSLLAAAAEQKLI